MSRKPFVRWAALVIAVLAVMAVPCHSKCAFEAVFNFGDSNTDTGGFYAAFPAQTGPFGMTYFNRPSGRASDGRLVVDFLGKFLQTPMISTHQLPIHPIQPFTNIVPQDHPRLVLIK